VRIPRPSTGLLVAVLIWALPLTVIVLLFGGEQFNPDCHIDRRVGAAYPPAFFPAGCSPSLPGPIPVIGTQAGAIGTLIVAGVGWIAALVLLLWQTWRRGRRSFTRVVVGAGVVGVVAGTIGLAERWQSGYPGKSGIVEAFGLAGGAAVLIALILFLALATIRAERRNRESESIAG